MKIRIRMFMGKSPDGRTMVGFPVGKTKHSGIDRGYILFYGYDNVFGKLRNYFVIPDSLKIRYLVVDTEKFKDRNEKRNT